LIFLDEFHFFFSLPNIYRLLHEGEKKRKDYHWARLLLPLFPFLPLIMFFFGYKRTKQILTGKVKSKQVGRQAKAFLYLITFVFLSTKQLLPILYFYLFFILQLWTFFVSTLVLDVFGAFLDFIFTFLFYFLLLLPIPRHQWIERAQAYRYRVNEYMTFTLSSLSFQNLFFFFVNSSCFCFSKNPCFLFFSPSSCFSRFLLHIFSFFFPEKSTPTTTCILPILGTSCCVTDSQANRAVWYINLPLCSHLCILWQV
jgi:hypothetical protein